MRLDVIKKVEVLALCVVAPTAVLSKSAVEVREL